MTQFFGKYRGKVESNNDPRQLGRLQVSVPAVLGATKLPWAMPCVPYAGNKVGFFALPPKGANLWVEFEGGDIDYPIWTGCFWDANEMPVKPAIATTKMLKTESIELRLNDAKGAGGVTLKVGSPGVSVPITINATSNGVQITMQGAKLRLTPTAIDLTLPPAAIKLAAAGLKLKHAGSEISLQQIRINLNNGALEVT
jgi:hypothetical protein